jgi:glycosyltransferase involved in cell wall biosynthesis
VLFVGNYNVEKGLEYLVEGFKAVADARPDSLLCIAGSGPLEQSIQQQIDRLGIGARVKRVGRMPHADIPTYLNAICCACPVCGKAARTSGAPVVSSDVGAVPDILAHAAI